MQTGLIEWQENQFNEFISAKGNGIVEFGAPWCGTCKMTEPMIEEISQNFSDITFVKIDVAKSPELASKMGVMSLPNIFFIKEGKVSDQIIGSTSKSTIEEKIKKIY